MWLKKNVPRQKQQFLVNYFACSWLHSLDCCDRWPAKCTLFRYLPLLHRLTKFHDFLINADKASGMGACRHRQGGTCPSPWKCRKVLFVLQMLSKVSVDEVFMHHFEKMSSASGGLAPCRLIQGLCLWTPLGTSVLQTPHCPFLEKIPIGRLCFRAEE